MFDGESDVMLVSVADNSVALPGLLSPTSDYPSITYDAKGFAWEDEGTYGVVSIGSMPRRDSLFVVSDVVAGMRGCLGQNQGLVAIEEGETSACVPYRETLVKTSIEFGVQYTLSLQLDCDTSVVSLTAFAEENGTTGTRDSFIFASCQNQGIVNGFEGWNIDPIEDHPVDGFPMNLSELEDFDEHFPMHPLSELRSLARFVLKRN